AAQREISRQESCEGEQSVLHRDERRSRWLLRSTAKREFLENWERNGRTNWNANQAALCRYERRLLNYELAVKASAAARTRLSRTRHFNDETDGIQWFEHNLERLGLDSGSGGAGSGAGAGAAGGALLPDKETSATFRSRLVRAVLDQKFVPSSNAETMAELRFRGTTGRRGRQEREHRRVKTEVDQRRAQAETDVQRKADNELKGMLNEGRERREAAAVSCRTKYNRRQKGISDEKRFAAKSAALEGKFEAAFNARARHVRESYEKSRHEREAKAGALRAELREISKEKRRRAEVTCLHVAHKISDLAVVASEARVLQGGVPLPPTTWENLKRWFCSPEPFFVDITPPEPPLEPSDPVLDAKALIESRNLDHHEGPWRLPRDPLQTPPVAPCPLSRALHIARELVEGPESGPRETPRCTRHGREMSVRLVLLGLGRGKDNILEELERWTRLSVCSLETALECALEVGAEVAVSEGKGTKGSKASASGKNAVDDDGESEDTGSKETINERYFHPDATEEAMAAFKEAAAAYHALRTHPKKALTPVALGTTTDLLVKHLACRAPKGRGWILAGYPASLLESKMLENALSGYTDEDVAAELGAAGKALKGDSKTKKGSVVPGQQEELPHIPPRSGLDAILSLTRLRSTATCRTSYPRDSCTSVGDNGLAMMVGDEPTDAPSTREGEVVLDQSKNDEDTMDDGCTKQRDSQIRWWQDFDGGHLSCDVTDEANDERLLETLFLLVTAAQIRKDEHQIYEGFEGSTRNSLQEGTAHHLESDNATEPEGAGITPSTVAPVMDRPSPLSVPLNASLEDLRRERRRSMPHSTRIRVEALTGDRELDLGGIRTVIFEADARREGSVVSAATISLGGSIPSASMPRSSQLLRKLEAECSALFVVDWAAAAEFSFSRELRKPDQRLTAACNVLEGQIAGWLARRGNALVAGRSRGGRGGCVLKDGRGCQAAAAATIPPTEEDRVWHALDAFLLEAGDVVDDRHSSAEALMREVENEANRRVRSWTRNLEIAAARLCAAERATHLETLGTLRALDRLFGLEDESTGSADQMREATCTAADALWKELSVVLKNRLYVSEGGGFEEEVRQAIEGACENYRTTSSAHDPRQKLTPLEALGSENQPEASLTQRFQHVDNGEVQRHNSGESSSHRTDSATDSKTTTEADSRSGKCDRDEENGALTMAVWRCRQSFFCRLRGIVVRILRAVDHCEANVSSMRAALRRLKRHRVQAEHESISTGTATVRRAIEECDYTAVADILKYGIPVWVEDDETFAADPYVALPWGMNGLGLPHIASLADTLRRSLSEAEGGDGETATVPIPDLSRAARAWLQSQAADNSKEEGGADIPRAWMSPSGGYVDTLCGAIATKTGQVSWRRLVHYLLLGHVRSIPTPDELRSMRRALSLKAQAASKPPAERGLKRSSTTDEVGPDGDSTSPDASTFAPVSVSGPPISGAAHATIRVARRHFQTVPLWFEQQEKDEKYCSGRSGSVGWSSMIRAVYTALWGGDDGRVDGMDLLLALCAVPDNTRAGGVGASRDDGDNVEDTGIPFSAGLFRAFYMLAETPPSPTNGAMIVDQNSGVIASTGSRSSSTGSPPKAAAASVGVSLSVDQRNDDGVPRVSLPQLRAILRYGGMTPTAASDVCDSVAETEAEWRSSSQIQRQEIQRDTTVANVVPEHATSVEHETVAAERTTGRGTEFMGADEEVRETEMKRALIDSVDGEQAADGQDSQLRKGNPPFTLSFAAVSECKAVRDWVRKGAYTLPAFDITSGQRRDTL
ncbi:unnamed protein product, partial [Hapterophycus canaliculatus]